MQSQSGVSYDLTSRTDPVWACIDPKPDSNTKPGTARLTVDVSVDGEKNRDEKVITALGKAVPLHN